jgi:hypothetical protein
MSAMQKFAWYNLCVIAVTVAVVGVLSFWGKGALGGFGFAGLLGFGVLFFRQKSGQVLTDERDVLIQQRSWVLAYSLFWVVFVLTAALVAPLVYGWEGSVPVWVIQSSVFCWLMLLMALVSIAILVQYARGNKDGN